jgi:hypothetical protein
LKISTKIACARSENGAPGGSIYPSSWVTSQCGGFISHMSVRLFDQKHTQRARA